MTDYDRGVAEGWARWRFQMHYFDVFQKHYPDETSNQEFSSGFLDGWNARTRNEISPNND